MICRRWIHEAWTAVILAVTFLALISGCINTARHKPSLERSTDREKTSPITRGEKEESDKTGKESESANEERHAEEIDRIKKAAVSGAKANNPSLPELVIHNVKRVGDWARVDLEPADRSTDTASVFLKKENGNWIVVDLGTGITPESHPEAPVELFD